MKLNDFQPVQATQFFAASAEQVFDAWINPAIIKQWLFKSSTNEIISANTDPQAGGYFSILGRNDQGEEIDHFGNYITIDAPMRLSFSLEVPKHFSGKTVVSVLITPQYEGCKLTLSQVGVAPEVTQDNWNAMLQQLNEIL